MNRNATTFGWSNMTVDAPDPCPRCGSLARRYHDGVEECAGCRGIGVLCT